MVKLGDRYHVAERWAKNLARAGPEAHHSKTADGPQATTRCVPSQRRYLRPLAPLDGIRRGMFSRLQTRDALGLGAAGIDQENIALIAGLAVHRSKEALIAREPCASDGRGVDATGNTTKRLAGVGRDQQGAPALGQCERVPRGGEQWLCTLCYGECRSVQGAAAVRISVEIEQRGCPIATE